MFKDEISYFGEEKGENGAIRHKLLLVTSTGV